MTKPKKTGTKATNTDAFDNPYETEHDLCNAFIDLVRQHNAVSIQDMQWEIQGELAGGDGGWDIVLFNRHSDLFVGIEAKNKRRSMKVVSQALPPGIGDYQGIGPDYRMVLLPALNYVGESEDVFYAKVLTRLKIIPVGMYYRRWSHGGWSQATTEDMTQVLSKLAGRWDHYLWHPKKRMWFPDVEIQVDSGVRSPRKVSRWKYEAVKLAMRLRAGEQLSLQDFKDARVSMDNFVGNQYMLPVPGERRRRHTKYVLNPNNPGLPDAQYPEIVEALKSSTATPIPAETPTVTKGFVVQQPSGEP